jgi:hypothetical protein
LETKLRMMVLLVVFSAAFLAVAIPAWAQAAQPTFAPASGSPFAAGNAPESITSADYNGDGKPDLATANFIFPSNNVSVLLNTATGANYMGFIYGSPNNEGYFVTAAKD